METFCGCRIIVRSYRQLIEFCPLHAAAPKMLEALRPFAALLQKHMDEMPDHYPVWAVCDAKIRVGDLRSARAAIAAAKGGADRG